MSNLSRVKFRKAVPLDKIKETVEKINSDYFFNELEISYDIENGIMNGFSIKNTESFFESFIWIENEQKRFEWKVPIDQFAFWITYTVMCRFIMEIDPKRKIYEEGIGKYVKPDFYITFPIPMDWMTSMYKSMDTPKLFIRMQEKLTNRVYANNSLWHKLK